MKDGGPRNCEAPNVGVEAGRPRGNAVAISKVKTLSLPVFNSDTPADEFDEMARNARDAADFLKALSHEARLMILCHLASGEKSVTELEQLLSSRQAAVSQQLMRLRQEGFVKTRREGKQIFYSLKDDRAVRIIDVVYDLFCR